MEEEEGKEKECFHLSLSFLLTAADLTNDSCIITISHVFDNVLCLDCQLSWWSTLNGAIQEWKPAYLKSMSRAIWRAWAPYLKHSCHHCKHFLMVFNLPSENSTAGSHKYTLIINCSLVHKCIFIHIDTSFQESINTRLTILSMLLKSIDNNNQRILPWLLSVAHWIDTIFIMLWSISKDTMYNDYSLQPMKIYFQIQYFHLKCSISKNWNISWNH